MANVTGRIFLNNISIVEIDSSPIVSGVEANIGSLAIETGSGNLWRKVGPNNTDWVEVFVNQSQPGQPSSLVFRASTESTFTLRASNTMTSSLNFVLPTSNPSIGQQLTIQNYTNGSSELKWGNDDAASMGFTNNKYYGGFDLIEVLTTSVVVNNRLYAIPFYVPFFSNFNRIGVEVTTAVAGSQLRLGVYGVNSNSEPGNLVVDAGVVDAATVGIKESIININLSPGWYYLAMATSGNPNIRSVPTARSIRPIMGSITPSSNFFNLNIAYAFGPLPSVFPPPGYDASNRPWLWLRRV